jgi:hypothetical protein
MAERKSYYGENPHRFFPDELREMGSPTVVADWQDNPIRISQRVREIRKIGAIVTRVESTAIGALIYFKPEAERTDIPGETKPTAIFESPVIK